MSTYRDTAAELAETSTRLRSIARRIAELRRTSRTAGTLRPILTPSSIQQRETRKC